jgi:alginate biosynthesis protein AlgX
MVGGSYDGSLIQYLLSDDFQQAPPKILIWEVPGYHRIQSELFYRQIRPMITDGCNSREIQLTDEKELLSGRNEMLFNGGGAVQKLLSGSLVLDLTFDNPEVKKARLTVWYVSGKREKIHLEIPSRISTNGRFMVELNYDETYRDQTYLGLDIEVPADDGSEQNIPTSVRASLCTK